MVQGCVSSGPLGVACPALDGASCLFQASQALGQLDGRSPRIGQRRRRHAVRMLRICHVELHAARLEFPAERREAFDLETDVIERPSLRRRLRHRRAREIQVDAWQVRRFVVPAFAGRAAKQLRIPRPRPQLRAIRHVEMNVMHHNRHRHFLMMPIGRCAALTRIEREHEILRRLVEELDLSRQPELRPKRRRDTAERTGP